MFDIIIATYNNIKELKNCLKSFEDQTYKAFNIFVCVDGSTDGTLEFLGSADLNFKFKVLQHPNGKNHGRNASRNLAIPYLRADHLLIFDSDIVASEDLIEQHYGLLKKTDCVSVGEVIYKNADKNIWANYVQKRGKGKYKHKDEIPFLYLTTGNVALKTKYFLEIDGQDPNMKTYGGGDTEFAYRLHKKANLSTYFNKNAIGYSVMTKSLSFALDQMQEFGAINLNYISKKHPDFKELFWFGLMTAKGIKPLLFRMLLSKINEMFALLILPIVPAFLKMKLIGFLVLYRIYKGYKLTVNN